MSKNNCGKSSHHWAGGLKALFGFYIATLLISLSMLIFLIVSVINDTATVEIYGIFAPVTGSLVVAAVIAAWRSFGKCEKSKVKYLNARPYSKERENGINTFHWHRRIFYSVIIIAFICLFATGVSATALLTGKGHKEERPTDSPAYIAEPAAEDPAEEPDYYFGIDNLLFPKDMDSVEDYITFYTALLVHYEDLEKYTPILSDKDSYNTYIELTKCGKDAYDKYTASKNQNNTQWIKTHAEAELLKSIAAHGAANELEGMRNAENTKLLANALLAYGEVLRTYPAETEGDAVTQLTEALKAYYTTIELWIREGKDTSELAIIIRGLRDVYEHIYYMNPGSEESAQARAISCALTEIKDSLN